jgi:DNA-binding CsgD family transcriptional regulator
MGLPEPRTTDDGSERRGAAGLAVLFAAITALAAGDLISDMGEGASLRHTVVESVLLLAALIGLAAMLKRFLRLTRMARGLQREAQLLEERLAATAEDAARWRGEARDLLEGLGSVIDRQLTRWELTRAEKEVALLLLKGLSHKEVAAVRGVGEATARQQAAAVYRKAGLSGRHDLAAFFLEDLLLPTEP